MTDSKGPSAASSFFIWLAYLAAIALESLILCKTWWEFAALIVIGVVVFLGIMMPLAGIVNIKRHSAVHILLIAVLVLSAIIHKAFFG